MSEEYEIPENKTRPILHRLIIQHVRTKKEKKKNLVLSESVDCFIIRMAQYNAIDG